MKPNGRGQVVKFYTPNHYEDPEQMYLVLEFIEDGERFRALILSWNTRLSIP